MRLKLLISLLLLPIVVIYSDEIVLMHGNVKFVEERYYLLERNFEEYKLGELFYFTKMNFNESGFITQATRINKDDIIVFTETYIYDISNKIIEKVKYRTPSELESRTVYNYDPFGNLTYYIEYFSHGRRKTEFIYSDGLIKLSGESEWDQDTVIKFSNLYEYDEGKLHRIIYDANFYHDRLGNLNYVKRNNIYRKITYYNMNGLINREEWFSTDSHTPSRNMVYTYEYDENENWIRQLIHLERTTFGRTELIPIQIKERSIKYW